jgi:hypothetical protein
VPDRDNLEPLVRQAEVLLSDTYARDIHLDAPHVVAARGRSVVVRCAVTGWDGVGSVVLKRNVADDARGFTDWASLAFLSRVAEARGVAPCFYAGDVRARFFVMEDLGDSHTVEDLLQQEAAPVVDALVALAAAMARLVTATAGHEAGFMRLRAALPGAAALGRRGEAARWLEATGRVAAWADALAIPLHAGLDRAYAHVAAAYADPGLYLAFSHGDPAPSNNHLGASGARLVDFEYAGYRHALYDLTGWVILCPLPWTWVAAMDGAFRHALTSHAGGGLAAADYDEAWAALCAYRAVAMLTWFPIDLLVEEDAAWTPEWTRRAAVLSTVLRLRRVSSACPALLPLAALADQMCDRLQARWPDLGDGAPRWPAATAVP